MLQETQRLHCDRQQWQTLAEELQAELDGLKAEIGDLKIQNTDLRGEKEGLQNDVQGLQDQNQQLSTESRDLEADLADLQQEVEKLKGELDKARKELEKLRRNHADLQNQASLNLNPHQFLLKCPQTQATAPINPIPRLAFTLSLSLSPQGRKAFCSEQPAGRPSKARRRQEPPQAQGSRGCC